MKFTKMHGCGNDYVYVDCTQEELDNPEEAAIKVSDRHFGIGSDGLILIKKSDRADFFMDMYNADGSRGKMCGNGIRCVGKYVYDNGLTDKTEIKVDTLSGVKTLQLHVTDGKVSTVTVDMGAPILKADEVPADVSVFNNKLLNKSDMLVAEPLTVNGFEYHVTCVSMGNPHAIVYLDNNIDIKKFEIEKIGPAFEKHAAFPENVNTEFIQVSDKDNLNMRVWERGSGETWACGTGACAVAVAACENGFCKKGEDIKIKLKGGDLVINYTDETVYMTGNAEKVFEGEIEV